MKLEEADRLLSEAGARLMATLGLEDRYPAAYNGFVMWREENGEVIAEWHEAFEAWRAAGGE